MITKPIAVSAAGRSHYHGDAWSLEKTREGAINQLGQCTAIGMGAEALGIDGPVSLQVFNDVMSGQIDGKQVAAGHVNVMVENEKTGEKERKGSVAKRTDGWDVTFSVDPSISDAALRRGDTRILAAVQVAARRTMAVWAQKAARCVTSVNGEKQMETTGKWVAFEFPHTTNFKNEQQVHIHYVVANVTIDKYGDLRALANKGLFTYRGEMDRQVFSKELKSLLHELGYQTTQGRSGVALAGYTQAQKDIIATRRSGDMVAKLAEKGLTLATATEAERSQANRALRKGHEKEHLTQEQQYAKWDAQAKEAGLAPAMREQSRAPKVSVEKLDRAAVTKIVDQACQRMNAAREQVVKLTGEVAAARKAGDTAGLDHLVGKLNAARAELMPVYQSQILSGVVADKAVKDAAIKEAVTAGKFHLHGAKLSVETPAELKARKAMDKAAERSFREHDVKVAVTKLVSQLQMSAQVAKELSGSLAQARMDGRQDAIKVISEQLREVQRTAAMTAGQMSYLVRQDVQFATKASIEAALRDAVNSKTLNIIDRNGDRKPVYSVQTVDERKGVQSALSAAKIHNDVERALATIIENKHKVRADVFTFTEELKNARLAGNEKQAAIFQERLKDAERQLSEMSEKQIGFMIREQLKSEVKPVLGELGDNRQAQFERYVKEMAPKIGPGQDQAAASKDKGVFVTAAQVADAVAKFEEQGCLHLRDGKYSIETDAQVEHRAALTHENHVSAKAVQNDRTQSAKEANYAITSKANAEQRKVQSQQRSEAAEEARRPEHYRIGGLFKPVYVLANPWSVATYSSGKAASAVAKYDRMSTGASLVIKSGWAAYHVGRGALRAAVGAARVIDRTAMLHLSSNIDRAQAASKVLADYDKLRSVHDMTKLTTSGYRENAQGDVYRANFTLRNFALISSALTTRMLLGDSITSKAIRNELVRHVSTRKVNAQEALFAKTLMGIGSGLRYTGTKCADLAAKVSKKLEANRHQAQLRARQEIYKDHLRVDEALRHADPKGHAIFNEFLAAKELALDPAKSMGELREAANQALVTAKAEQAGGAISAWQLAQAEKQYAKVIAADQSVWNLGDKLKAEAKELRDQAKAEHAAGALTDKDLNQIEKQASRMEALADKLQSDKLTGHQKVQTLADYLRNTAKDVYAGKQEQQLSGREKEQARAAYDKIDILAGALVSNQGKLGEMVAAVKEQAKDALQAALDSRFAGNLSDKQLDAAQKQFERSEAMTDHAFTGTKDAWRAEKGILGVENNHEMKRIGQDVRAEFKSEQDLTSRREAYGEYLKAQADLEAGKDVDASAAKSKVEKGVESFNADAARDLRTAVEDYHSAHIGDKELEQAKETVVKSSEIGKDLFSKDQAERSAAEQAYLKLDASQLEAFKREATADRTLQAAQVDHHHEVRGAHTIDMSKGQDGTWKAKEQEAIRHTTVERQEKQQQPERQAEQERMQPAQEAAAAKQYDKINAKPEQKTEQKPDQRKEQEKSAPAKEKTMEYDKLNNPSQATANRPEASKTANDRTKEHERAAERKGETLDQIKVRIQQEQLTGGGKSKSRDKSVGFDR